MLNIACLLANIRGCLNNNAAGQAVQFCLIPVGEVLNFPATIAEFKELSGAEPDFGDELCLTQGFTLTPDSDGWHQINALCDTVGLEYNLVGEKGSYAFENKFLFYLPGMGKEQLQFAKTVATCCEGFIIKTRGCNGITYIIGTPDNPAFIESLEGSSGVSITERRGAPYVFRAPSKCPPFVYDEDTLGITLAPDTPTTNNP